MSHAIMKLKSLVQDPGALREETPPHPHLHPLCFGLVAAVTPP